MVLLKFWYIYVSKFEETFICKEKSMLFHP